MEYHEVSVPPSVNEAFLPPLMDRKFRAAALSSPLHRQAGEFGIPANAQLHRRQCQSVGFRVGASWSLTNPFCQRPLVNSFYSPPAPRTSLHTVLLQKLDKRAPSDRQRTRYGPAPSS